MVLVHSFLWLSNIPLLTQWTWVWINSGSWWWTGRPGVLQSMGSLRVGHDWVNWYALIHWPDIPGFYAILLRIASDFLPLSPVTFTSRYCFCFDSVSSFFLESFLQWAPVAYCAPTDLRSSSFSVLSFCLFILFMGFSRQEYWHGLPFPPPVGHILSELSTMPRLGWPYMAWLIVSLN